MIIRRAKKKDIDKLSVLFDKYRIFYKQRSDIDNAKSFLKKRMKRMESVIFVAEERKELIGFTQLFPIFSSVSMKRTWLLNDLYLNNVNLKMNEVMKVMAIVTCLLAPATVIGGIFGMNFDTIPWLQNPYGFFGAVIVMLAIPIWMLWFFRKRGWF